ncbi:Acg family FMN-binding oxidoreductase [Streptomyces silvensis]|uniref:Aromatic ring-opening dioxygenase LigA n=1 Tax=Streptomyces silvensis TaxID=1765722 RepID=A0A0W7WQM7_9ACTN|nr:hypothetical protein [Streptomyces silvensis]KUF12899.1 aromatic ring-opening dioxygenase LigA [Streptomyces silvensis]
MCAAVLDGSTLEKLVAAAVAAPSIHNTQPWRFRLDLDTVALEVRAARRPDLPHIDPVGRAMHVSVGCAVFNLRVAVAYFGWSPVARLLPDPDQPDLLATLPLSGTAEGATRLASLYEAVFRRHSSRLPFSERRFSDLVWHELSEVAQAEGAQLIRLGTSATSRVFRLMREADRRTVADADRAAESRRWVHDPDGTDLGVPLAALGPQDAREQVPMRDFGAHRHQEVLVSRSFERRPAVAVLSTAHDRRVDWLRAGQALEHVLLAATTRGLRASLLHQALEWPDLRAQLLSEHGDRGACPQMVIRLGYGPEGPPTPRRVANHALDTDGASGR